MLYSSQSLILNIQGNDKIPQCQTALSKTYLEAVIEEEESDLLPSVTGVLA